MMIFLLNTLTLEIIPIRHFFLRYFLLVGRILFMLFYLLDRFYPTFLTVGQYFRGQFFSTNTTLLPKKITIVILYLA